MAPTPGVPYSTPSPPQTWDIEHALKNPRTVTWCNYNGEGTWHVWSENTANCYAVHRCSCQPKPLLLTACRPPAAAASTGVFTRDPVACTALISLPPV